MKHVMLNSSFTFEPGEVPGFCHKYIKTADSVFIPVNGIEPVAFYQVILNNASREIIHRTGDLSDAGTHMNAYNDDPNHECTRASVRVIWALPENRFRLIMRQQTAADKFKLTILQETDDTPRVLAFIGCEGGRSRAALDTEKSTAPAFINSCDPESNQQAVQVVTVMNIGEKLVFTLSDPDKPNDNQLRIYTWTGSVIDVVTIPSYQWSAYLTKELMEHPGSTPANWNQI